MITSLNVPDRFMQRLGNMPQKKKGAILSIETIIYIAVLIIFIAVGIAAFSQRESAKAAACQSELDQIRSAIVQYQSLRVDSKYPSADLNEIAPGGAGIDAADSVDGISHKDFLQKAGRWKDGKLNNPWGDGDGYTFTESDGVIHSGHIPANGEELTLSLGQMEN